MSDVAIRVENLSKLYRIGGPQARYQTLRDTVMDLASAPLQRLRRLVQPASTENTIWALKDVSLEVKRGEVLGIIGRNGAGKTTLLKILSRITEPTKGQAEIYGRVGSLLEVGTGFHPELTGRENIYLSGAILGMKRAEIDEKFDEIVQFAEIDKFLDTPVKRYSSGMYVRLAFAVAAHLEPEILLVDEVLAVGDIAFQRKCLGKMGDVAGEGRTVLFVSHNMAATQSLCSRAILLDKGLVAAEGGAGSVVADYLKSSERITDLRTADLSAIDRAGGLSTVFQAGWMNGSPIAGIHSVDPLSPLHFELVIALPRSMGRCWMGIYLENDTGVRLLGVNTRWRMGPVSLKEGSYRASCHIPRIMLVPGSYHLTVGFTADGQQADMLERIGRVDIVPTDIYGSGELPWPGQGYFVSEADWNLQPIEPEEHRHRTCRNHIPGTT
jgi:lipopolysaccharide transport system ATP-binding protein